MSDLNQTVGESEREPSSPALAEVTPIKIGRYRIERVLGRGGFGLVYLAHDDQLQRPVAIKVPHARLVAQTTNAEAYLAEARTVANLDHPHIVPVFDVGSTDLFPCFVVSKFIDGADLATRLTQSRLSLRQVVELVATVAEALHHAHKQGLVHRDIKPGNILLDKGGKPFVGDFGMALREQDVGKGPRFAGTPVYMSPEQARGEGHRVDGRSDIYSLGVVFYELLVGRRPFKAESQGELLEQISNLEARPPRQIDDQVPKELDRICLKALAKRASERYSAARDMAEDLRHFLAAASEQDTSSLSGRTVGEMRPQSSRFLTDLGAPAPIKIIPKGLRSFDAADADFFLELLPGPRDRDGLPDSIRFWKNKIDTTDADNTFSVGLIYGPSGCGKTSLVKAGLLPSLAKAVTPVYLEATAEETEARLLKMLRRQVADLPGKLGLIESLAALRGGRYLEPGQKVVLVLDQFEQWLHAKRDRETTELVQALRHCDGGRLQCLVMVRDDFWLAVSRFMQALEIRVVEGENSRLVDLFDARHARKVLTSFGKALGALPEARLDKDQDVFLDQALAGLAQDGKVVSVRLALFAEMVKGRAWIPMTLKEMGGTEGVGVTFLEETFTSATAPPQHRLHQKAAQAVLKQLLPEAGSDIKGHMRSRQDLLFASGYANHARDFEELLRILDTELRLITPADPEGIADEENSAGTAAGSTPAVGQAPSEEPAAHHGDEPRRWPLYYQLTHDYLVPSLRDWLTRKQKETRRGRAELLLADRTAVWNARPENRQLPSLLNWLQIRALTAKKNWTPPQRKMMKHAGRYHSVRGMLVALVLGLLIWGVQEEMGRLKAHALKNQLLDANTLQVPAIVNQMDQSRRWLDPLLYQAFAQAEAGRVHRKQIDPLSHDASVRESASQDARILLHVSLALLPVDATQVQYLYERLLESEPHEVSVIRDALAPHKNALVDKLWAVVESPRKDQEPRRLRAAATLATYDPVSDKWTRTGPSIVNDLILENPLFLGLWSDAFRPVAKWLLVPLQEIFRDQRPERAAERNLATAFLAGYAADQAQLLADMLMDADEKQFAAIFPMLQQRGEQDLPVLSSEIDRKLPADAKDDDKEKLAKRQANAAVALLKMNRPGKVWPMLRHIPDPRARSYLIDRLSPLGASAEAIVRRLDSEPDITIRRGLILSLGEFGEEKLPSDERKALIVKLQDSYRNHADPGLHASVEWLLRTWKKETLLKQVNDEWANDKDWRQKRLESIKKALAKDKEKTPPQWYVNSQTQTMVVFPGPVEFLMGSPPMEAGRQDNEPQHKRRIGRTFVLAAKPVTVEQYRQFDKDYQLPPLYTRMADLPVNGIDWFRAAQFCNWLSAEEGIPDEQRCYQIASNQIKLKANYLSLSGYRLPTEAEMEYATRAGAVTRRYFGETDDLLPKYAWYQKNSQERTWPVGSLKPNDFGLFDVQGNVNTWCQESHKAYPRKQEVSEDEEDGILIDHIQARVLRGGTFNDHPSILRSATRNFNVPGIRILINGFRLARTLPVSSSCPPTGFDD